jgi:hypothetical protein
MNAMANGLANALQVLTLTPHIRAYLTIHDPKALQQAETALEGQPGAIRTMDELVLAVRELTDEQGARRVLGALAQVLFDRETEARGECCWRHADKLAAARAQVLAANAVMGDGVTAGTTRGDLLARLRALRAERDTLETEIEELEGVLC